MNLTGEEQVAWLETLKNGKGERTIPHSKLTTRPRPTCHGTTRNPVNSIYAKEIYLDTSPVAGTAWWCESPNGSMPNILCARCYQQYTEKNIRKFKTEKYLSTPEMLHGNHLDKCLEKSRSWLTDVDSAIGC